MRFALLFYLRLRYWRSRATTAEERGMPASRALFLTIAFVLIAGCSSTAERQAVPATLPYALSGNAVDAHVRTLLYAGGPGNNAVDAYPAGENNPKPLREIVNGLSAPTGIAVDSAGNVYVCNNSGFGASPKGKGNYWTVTVYKRGQKSPFESYTNGVWSPVDVAVAADGTVYIANFSSAVTVYPAGSLDPSLTLVGPSGQAPLGIAIDDAGNIYVSYVFPSGGGSIYKYAPSRTKGKNLGIAFSGGSPHGLAFDSRGNLVVAVSKAPSPGSNIEVFTPGSVKPKRTITGVFQPFMLAFNKSGRNLFVADYGNGNGSGGGVLKLAYPSGKLVSADVQGAAAWAYGVALDP
jgi:sugar lactone lactonase YvrE